MADAQSVEDLGTMKIGLNALIAARMSIVRKA
jgi:hypothetical protein